MMALQRHFHTTTFYGNIVRDGLRAQVAEDFHTTTFYGNPPDSAVTRLGFVPYFHTTTFYGNRKGGLLNVLLTKRKHFHTTTFYGNVQELNHVGQPQARFPHDYVLRKHIYIDNALVASKADFHTTTFYGNCSLSALGRCINLLFPHDYVLRKPLHIFKRYEHSRQLFPHDYVLRKRALDRWVSKRKLDFHTTTFYGNLKLRLRE